MEPAPFDSSQDLNTILQGMDSEGTVHNPVVYPGELPQMQGTLLASATISFPPLQVDLTRLIGGVFQRIDVLQQMLLQRIEALEARLTALEAKSVQQQSHPSTQGQ